MITQTFEAIQSKILPATTYKGTRVKAWIYGVSHTINYNYSFNTLDNHKRAAEELIHKLQWRDIKELQSGVLPNGDYCHCLIHWDSKSYEIPQYLREQA